MRPWGLLLVVAACYEPPLPPNPCAITCGSDQQCPDGSTCTGGYCVEPGQVCQPKLEVVSAGEGFACALDDAHALWCWGSNLHHQISPDLVQTFPLATRISTDAWTAISTGGGHTCGIRDGVLLCWGANDTAQILASVSGDAVNPTVIPLPANATRWLAVSAGVTSTCGIVDPGSLYCWGSNDQSTLGTGDGKDHGSPTAVDTTLHDWTTVVAGATHSCAISASAGAFCWGNDEQGAIGPNGVAFMLFDSPVAVPLPAAATSLAVSMKTTCATLATGDLYCWGSNDFEELGDQLLVNPTSMLAHTDTPTRATTITGWTSVSGFARGFCGLHGDEVDCWGTSSLGGLGAGVWDDHGFHKVMTGASQIAMGWNNFHDVALQNEYDFFDLGCAVAGNDVQCWGTNIFGELGTGGVMQQGPVEVSGGHLFSEIAAGDNHVCGIENGTLSCWGSTTLGQTTGIASGGGTPRTPCASGLDCDLGAPKALAFVPSTTQIAAGVFHSCAFHNNILTCWGLNTAGQLGTAVAGPRPRDVPGVGGRPWAGLVQTGDTGQCATPSQPTVAGETACWGIVLGSQLQPMDVPQLTGERGLGFGYDFQCFLDAGSQLWCIGADDQAQFGRGAAGTGAEPLTSIGRTYDAIAVNDDALYVCGLVGGHVECWGLSRQGETSELPGVTLSPRVVLGLPTCTAISAQSNAVCAICDGQIWCWGNNQFGNLGTGTPTTTPNPVPSAISLVLPNDPWIQLVSGEHFTCARSAAGHVYCWGTNVHGALGNGVLGANVPGVVRATPVP